jgi:hypothetical protein
MYTLKGKPDQHDTYASHASPHTPSVCFLWAVPVRDNLWRGADRFGQIPLLLRKKGSRHNPQHAGWPIRGSAPSFSPKPANEAGGVSQAPDNDQLLGLPGPYQRHVIGTFNTCSWGLTEQSLIDTGRGYNLGGAGLPHTHSPTFPTSCLSFPLVAPPDLHFNQAPLLKPQLNFGEPVAATWSFDHSAIYGSLHLQLAIANGLSLAMESQG